MALPKNHDNWQFTKKIAKIGHNRAVKKHFSDVKTDSGRANGRQAIKTALLIKNTDSANEIIVKILHFRFGLIETNIDTVVTHPEAWHTHPISDDIPQLVVVYRGARERTGNYSVTIPHYSGSKTPNFPRYTKGNATVVWVLRDSSKVVVNAKTHQEGLKFLKRIEKYIPVKYHSTDYRKSIRKDIKIREFKPVRADFYPKGRKSKLVAWRHYFL